MYSSVVRANEKKESIWETPIPTQTSFTGEQAGGASLLEPPHARMPAWLSGHFNHLLG